jgi:non-ribosomal peptide synthetase component F
MKSLSGKFIPGSFTANSQPAETVVAELELDPRYPTDAIRAALGAVLAEQELTEMMAEPAELSRLVNDLDPSTRATNVRTPVGDRSVLVVAIHGTVRQFAAALAAALTGEPNAHQWRERTLREVTADPTDPAVSEAVALLEARARAVPPTVLYPLPGAPEQTDRSVSRVRVELPIAIDHALQVTSSAFFSAVYAAALARYTGNAVVTFGAQSRGGTVPVVLEVDWNRPFSDFVTGSAAPAVTTAEQLSAAWTGTDPAFSAVIAVRAEAPGPVRAIRERGAVDLPVRLEITGRQIELEYDTNLVPGPVAAGFAACVRDAALRAAADPDRPLANLFTDGPTDSLRVNDGRWQRPPASSLDGWLRRTADVSADLVAVEEGASRLSYRQLAAAVRATAAGLREHGVRPRDVVGLSTTTLTDTVITMLAVLRSGARYLPLDHTLASARPTHQLAAADCRLVVGGDVPGAAAAGVVVVEPGDLLGPAGPDRYRPPGAAGHVVFAGGPRGVSMGEGALVNLTAWQVAALDMTNDSRFLRYTPFGLAASFQEIVPTLAAGGTVVATTGGDFPALVAQVARDRITHVLLPEAALHPFVRAATAAGAELPALTHLCVSGAGPEVGPRIEEFLSARPWTRLVSLYGPAETGTAMVHRLSSVDREWPGHVPLGRPITGVVAQVIDRTGHLAPPGAVGELMLGGRCHADGYLADDTAVTEHDPHGSPRARRHRTGDRVLWTPEKTLVFLGRGVDEATPPAADRPRQTVNARTKGRAS